jgi:hypothetical protein
MIGRKLTAKFIAFCLEGFEGIFGRRMRSTVILPILEPDPRSPFAQMFYPVNAAISVLIVGLDRISYILRGGHFPEIEPSIIRRIMVDVINRASSPLAGLICPHYLMCPDILVLDGYLYSAILRRTNVTGELAGSRSLVIDLPSKLAGLWIVGKVLTNKRWIKFWHDDIVYQATEVNNQ